jgi:RNA polymerase subunit RPABC4/transcription elongation factor Spt4
MQPSTCPNCHHLLRDGTQFCHVCGTAVATAQAESTTHAPSSTAPSRSAEHGSSCTNCGKPLRRGAQFCSGCGSAGPSAEAPPVSTEVQTESRPLAAGAPVMPASTPAFANVSTHPEVERTPIPPGLHTPPRPPSDPAYAAPPPANPAPRRSGNPLALIVLGVAALAGIAFAGLAVGGVFSHAASTQTVTSASAVRPSAGQTTAAAPRNPTPAAVAAPAGTTSCGGDLSVGPNTSCPFAQNVEHAYAQSRGGNIPVTAYSPATGLTYTIDCAGGSSHVCSGGTTHNASVYFTSRPSYSTPKATRSPQPSVTTTGEFASFAGTWGAHEERLVMDDSGTGHLSYADLTACPSCSFGTAPRGTVAFVLTSVTNGGGRGSVTTSSDPRNWAIGAPVEVSLSAASPGQFLDVVIGGKQLTNFCNSTSEGQCGA